MPNASVTHAMVFAVNMPLQEPQPGQATFSSAADSFSVILPAKTLPTASKTLLTPTFCPSRMPEAIGPPVTEIAGTSILAAAMSMPGVTLSQLEIITCLLYTSDAADDLLC